ncbi:hypothetical protein Scani_75410 [Streptomyces caniferus]|uniref:Uncharacterized protein n=1 Tax=Streptomyces caniferus TaxID=285557 RepID=A0A640SIB9_9ACTN|nr:hypothetical protein Scani_75410 [Streptomyces caniferus]
MAQEAVGLRIRGLVHEVLLCAVVAGGPGAAAAVDVARNVAGGGGAGRLWTYVTAVTYPPAEMAEARRR